MCKLQSFAFYVLAFLACFTLTIPMMAQEEEQQAEQQASAEITLYGKILKKEAATEESSASLELQELLPSHQKEAKARMFVLHKASNEERWEALEKYVGQEIKLRGALDASVSEEPLPMTVSSVEPLFQLVGKLSSQAQEDPENPHVEFREEPKGFLFKSSKIFNVLNSKEYPSLDSLFDQKILARGTTLIDETGQLAFNLWDARLLMDLECTLLEKKDDQGNVIGIELEDSTNQKRYLLNEEGLGEALTRIPGKRVKLSGYLETLEKGECFYTVQYEIVEKELEVKEEVKEER